MEQRDPWNTLRSPTKEAMIVEFRRRFLLPLDDAMGCLRDAILNPTRSDLDRCL